VHEDTEQPTLEITGFFMACSYSTVAGSGTSGTHLRLHDYIQMTTIILF